MNNEEYRQVNALSQSDLKLILTSPKHFINRDKLHGKETPAMRLGTAFHMAVCEPSKFKSSYLQLPSSMPNGEPINRRKKADKEYLESIALENPDKIALSEADMDTLTGMLNALLEHPLANSLFQGGIAEQSSFFELEGRECKARCDYFQEKHPLLGERILVELKSTIDASPVGFAREVINRRYDYQCSFYGQAFNADRVIVVAVEKSFPFPVAVYDMSEWKEKGDRDIKKSFELLTELESNPDFAYGYTKNLDVLPVPSWVASQSE